MDNSDNEYSEHEYSSDTESNIDYSDNEINEYYNKKKDNASKLQQLIDSQYSLLNNYSNNKVDIDIFFNLFLKNSTHPPSPAGHPPPPGSVGKGAHPLQQGWGRPHPWLWHPARVALPHPAEWRGGGHCGEGDCTAQCSHCPLPPWPCGMQLPSQGPH